MDKTTVRGQYAADSADRQQILDIARECSRLTDPTVLPYTDEFANRRDDVTKRPLPQNYQSLGSEGAITIEGKLLTLLYPPGTPWLKSDLSAEIMADPSFPNEQKQALLRDLMLQDLIILSALESNSAGDGEMRFSTFHTTKRAVISQLVITGDVLERMHDDYRIQKFGRDQYVTCRDSCGDVMYHITVERKDPFRLTPEQFAKSGLNRDDLKDLHVSKRMMDLYTNVELHPDTKKWVIKQELNDRVINESEEEVSPYFSTPFKLQGNYGRGLVELHLGDLASYDEGSLRFLDFMEMCSKFLTVIDSASPLRERDFAKTTGSVIRGRVRGGVIDDAAVFKVDKVPDFKVCAEIMDRIANRLGKVFLSGSNAVRDSERTTAFEVARATLAELEGAIGGVCAPIQDYQQAQTVNRTVWQLRRDKRLPLLDEKAKRHIKIKTLTGIAALADLRRAEELRNLVVDAQSLGDAGVAKLNIDVILDAIARYRRINEPGAIKSNEQVARERQEAIAAAAQMAANEKGIDVAGNVLESKLTGKK